MSAFFKQNVGPFLCSFIPLDIWHRLEKIELIVPHWHLASDQDLPHVTGLYRYRRCREFAEDVDYFLRHYKSVSMGDVIGYLNGVGEFPKRCVLFTFDDGFREIHDIVAPILYTKGVTATFFLITSVIDNRELCYPQKKSILINALASLEGSYTEREVARCLTEAGIEGPDIAAKIRNIYYRKRYLLDKLGSIIGCDYENYVNSVQPYLTTEQIKELLKKGFFIGAHSLDHPKYSELSLEEQIYQTIESTRFISTQFNHDCKTFAFPYTDRGISPDFYHKMFSENILKASFGIGGIARGRFLRHLPRFSMERTNLPAGKILARQFGRALIRRPLGVRTGSVV